jgi:Flp pilus assembly protein TadB
VKLRRRRHQTSIVAALNDIADALRSGASLRQAIVSTAGERSPLAPVAASLVAGQPMVQALRGAADALAHATTSDAASALCVLAVHAEAGGDPLPAVRSVVGVVARRDAARDEARALTTHARLGARAILCLTPAFLVLVALTDPHGATRFVTDPRTRLAIVSGLVLQALGAIWMRAIVSRAGGSSGRLERLPFLRAIGALAAGRVRSVIDVEVAECAEVIAFALDAGLAPSAAVRAVAPYARGSFGDALRLAASTVHTPLHLALAEVAEAVDEDAARQLARAFERSATLGVPLAPALRSLADDVHGSASLRLAEDIRRASLRVLVPLSLLVLPAFVLACLVPLFLGGLQQIAG